jgi:alpha-D-ribose 1-methylphosphonate 5-triphosphate diphosphatase
MIAFRAARVPVDGRELSDVWVTVEDGWIAAVDEPPPSGTTAVDVADLDLIPGLVDLHSDCLEERVRPRPGREQPLAAALLELDAEVAMHGITTHHLCVVLEDDALAHRSQERACETVGSLEAWRGRLRVEHRIHLRVELTSDALDTAAELAARDAVRLISYMQHAPGHGQFAANPAAWRATFAPGYRGSDAELAALLAERRHRAEAAPARRRDVAAIARASGTPLAAHDDASADDVRAAAELGACISEFPLSAEVAATARDCGLGVVMGAPNAWHGGSHADGPAARDVLAAGHLSALASDYHPPSLLAAAYALADEDLCSWPEAIALVSANPARLVGLTDRGSIARGRRADLVAVERVDGHAVVRGVWRGGTPVMTTARVRSRRA